MSAPTPEEFLDELADSFVERTRRGEQPSVDEYATRHPELADRIRTFFATLVFVEEVGQREGGTSADNFVSSTTIDQQPTELGDYRILREVGRGGMGIVYEAQQESLGRRVALKVLPRHALLDRKQLKRFRREAQSAAKLQHTNIVPVFGVGEHEGLHYFAMQFIQGQGLDDVLIELRNMRDLAKGTDAPSPRSDRIAEGLISGSFDSSSPVSAINNRLGEPCRPLSTGEGVDKSAAEVAVTEPTSDLRSGGPSNSLNLSSATLPSSTTSSGHSGTKPFYRSVAQIGVQAAEALDHAHGQRVLHRDVKPSNILLDIHANVWLTDFGLAKDEGADDLTNTGDLVGTLRYMAPEQFRGWADPRSDVYSLGLTLYELLTLQPAFDASDRGLLIKQVAHDKPTRPRRIDRHIPRDLETVVLRAIAKEPNQRYRSARELADDLRRYLEDKPILARRTPLREQCWLWCKRNPVIAALMFTIILGLSVATLWLRHERNVAVANIDRATEAEKAAYASERLATRRLFDSLLAQARSRRWSGRAGRTIESIQALSEATRLAAELGLDEDQEFELRNEAIASMSLLDVEVEKQWPRHDRNNQNTRIAFDPALDRYARLEFADDQSQLVVRRMDDNQILQRLSAVGTASHAPLLRFSPNGKLLAAIGIVGDHFQARVFDLESGETVFQATSFRTMHSITLDFSPDSRQLAALDERGRICVYNLAAGGRVRQFSTPAAQICCVRFSPDGGRVAVARQHQVDVLDIGSGKVVFSRKGIERRVRVVAWNRDGKRIAVTSTTHAHMIDLQTGDVTRFHGSHDHTIYDGFFNRRGDILATTTDYSTILWNTTTGDMILALDRVATAFSAGDKMLAWGTAGSSVGRWTIRDPDVDEFRTDVSMWNHSISMSPNGRLLANAQFPGVRFWDVSTGHAIGSIELDYPRFVRFNAAANKLWTGSNEGLLAWPVGIEGGHVTVGPPEIVIPPTTGECDAAMSLDERLATAGSGEIVVADLAKKYGNTRVLTHQNAHYHAISPDRKWVATGTIMGTGVRIWDAATGQLDREFDVPSSATVAFSPDDRWFVVGTQYEYVVRLTASWEVRHRIPRTTAGEEGPIAFDSQGRLLAIADAPTTIALIDVATWNILAHIPSTELALLAFSKDDSKLIAGAKFSPIQVWDLDRLRRQLAKIGLDWSNEDLPPEVETAKVRQPLELLVDWGYWPHFQRGQSLVREKRWEQAVAAFSRAFEANPQGINAHQNDAQMLVWRAWTHSCNGEFRKSISDYQRVLTLDPKRHRAANNLASIYANGPADLRNPKDALHLARSAVKLKPDSWNYRGTLGVVYFRLGRLKDAVDTLEKSTEMNQDSGTAIELFFLAMSHHSLGDTVKSQQCYQQAMAWTDKQIDLSSWLRREIDTVRSEAENHLRGRAEQVGRPF